MVEHTPEPDARWAVADADAIRAAVATGSLLFEVAHDSGRTEFLNVDDAAGAEQAASGPASDAHGDAVLEFGGGGKTSAMRRMLEDLVRAGRHDDLVLITDPKDPTAAYQHTTVGKLAAVIQPVGIVTVHQLDPHGVCWRESHHHPAAEDDRQALYARIERAYRMDSTMVTCDGAHEFGAQGTHAQTPARPRRA